MLKTPKPISYAIVIGRFQPFHNAHLRLVHKALSIADRVIIAVGSKNASRSVRNPWTADERIEMITQALPLEAVGRVSFATVRDYLYNDNIWLRELQNQIMIELCRAPAIGEVIGKVYLVGVNKDDTSYYLKLFPQWEFVDAGLESDLNATDIRTQYFLDDVDRRYIASENRYQLVAGKQSLLKWVPKGVFDWLSDYRGTPAWTQMHEEFQYVEDYKKKWAKSPFKPVFTTVDAVVIRSGHVLVVQRGRQPGKGLLALPGGFIAQDELIKTSMLRELAEETKIDVPETQLALSIADHHVFDHPLRSARGRTITHAYCINLGDGPLPNVSGADDADKAFWMSLLEVGANEPEFFEDHLHIITHFASKF